MKQIGKLISTKGLKIINNKQNISLEKDWNIRQKSIFKINRELKFKPEKQEKQEKQNKQSHQRKAEKSSKINNKNTIR